MGILSTDTKITATKLKELGFDKIAWGSPDYISYSKDGKKKDDANGLKVISAGSCLTIGQMIIGKVTSFIFHRGLMDL